MSERRRSAVALSSRAHAFSVEALIGSNKKRKLRDWDAKGLDLSMESLSAPDDDDDDDAPAAAPALEPLHAGESAAFEGAAGRRLPTGIRVRGEGVAGPLGATAQPLPGSPARPLGLALAAFRGAGRAGLSELPSPRFFASSRTGIDRPRRL